VILRNFLGFVSVSFFIRVVALRLFEALRALRRRST
jgi:hypothetical protein